MNDDKITIEGPGPLNPIGAPAIDWAKPVETVKGDLVHIYAIDHNLSQPVIGKRIGVDEVLQWDYYGRFALSGRERSRLDLRNVREATK